MTQTLEPLDKNFKMMSVILEDLLEKLDSFYGFMKISEEMITIFQDSIKILGNTDKKYFQYLYQENVPSRENSSKPEDGIV